MRAIKKINNNAAICIDDNGCELVALGTGIGFPACPYDIADLSIIQRTYYNVDPIYYDLLNLIPKDVLDTTINIVDTFKSKVTYSVSSNLVFTLADHIYFAIERFKKNIYIDSPLQYDIKNLYELEYKIGLDALKLVYRDLNIKLPKSEATYITMHFVNSILTSDSSIHHNYVARIIEDITDIIRKNYRLYINKDSFSYSRFVTHLQYLLKRDKENKLLSSDNYMMFDSFKNQYPKVYGCVLEISDYLEKELNMILGAEELLYLMLHINRLCLREDCYQKNITTEHKEK